MIKVKRYKPTFSRTDLPVPPLDFRKDVKGDKEKSWLILQQTHKAALQHYYLVVTHLLDRIDGMEITALRETLMYDYFCDSKLIDQTIIFLLNSTEVELEALTNSVNGAVLYRAPRIKVSVVGPYSPYFPHER